VTKIALPKGQIALTFELQEAIEVAVVAAWRTYATGGGGGTAQAEGSTGASGLRAPPSSQGRGAEEGARGCQQA